MTQRSNTPAEQPLNSVTESTDPYAFVGRVHLTDKFGGSEESTTVWGNNPGPDVVSPVTMAIYCGSSMTHLRLSSIEALRIAALLRDAVNAAMLAAEQP